MRLIDRLRPDHARSDGLSLDWLAQQYMNFQGLNYPLSGYRQGDSTETLDHSFEGYVRGAYQSDGIVASCIYARLLLFSEAEFQWQAVQDRKLFGNTELTLLEAPDAGVTTQDMLASCEVDLSLAGNAYWCSRGQGAQRHLRRLRPDWVSIVSEGEPDDIDSQLLGYVYHKGGIQKDAKGTPLLPFEVAHYTMLPDPLSRFRGQSWLTPVIAEITADKGWTKHRTSAVSNLAVPPFAIKYPPLDADSFRAAVASFREGYEGARNTGRPIHVSGGADIQPLSMSLKDLDFQSVLAGGETRIASAARVPAVVLGLSEALGGSALNAGNYTSSKRQFGDGYAHPHWRSLCGAFSVLFPTSPDYRLWYDDRNISFLREDQKDLAEVQVANATAIRQLVDGGFDPDTVVAAINGNDYTLLKHSGFLSVQLQEPGAQPALPAAKVPAALNGAA